jgi:hypothetical protein
MFTCPGHPSGHQVDRAAAFEVTVGLKANDEEQNTARHIQVRLVQHIKPT